MFLFMNYISKYVFSTDVTSIFVKALVSVRITICHLGREGHEIAGPTVDGGFGNDCVVMGGR